jgi:hypothetical protein
MTASDTHTKMTPLSKKELAARWQCSLRTVERDVRRFGLTPDAFTGRQPVFAPEAVERMESRRTKHKAKMAEARYRPEAAILTVKEAKRQAGRGAK